MFCSVLSICGRLLFVCVGLLEGLCVCVCVRVRARMFVSVCVCVRARAHAAAGCGVERGGASVCPWYIKKKKTKTSWSKD